MTSKAKEFQDRILSKFSGKADSHHYITELPEMKDNEELFK